jgi:membrane protease YdiL (CAAX protease family)
VTQPPPPSQAPPPDPRTRLDTPAPADPVDAPSAGWGAGRALAGLAILLVAVSIEAAIVAGFDPDIEALGARLVLQLALATSLIAVSVIAVQGANGRPGTPAWARLGLRRPVRPAVAAAILAYLAYVGVALLIAGLLNPEQEDVTRELGVDEGTFGAIAAGVLIVVAAPLSEEIFFRGFLFAGLRRTTGFVIGAVVSSGIWGLFHYTGSDSWPVVLQLSVFGVVLAWLYERTGSIWPTIAVHAFNNAVAFTVLTS